MKVRKIKLTTQILVMNIVVILLAIVITGFVPSNYPRLPVRS